MHHYKLIILLAALTLLPWQSWAQQDTTGKDKKSVIKVNKMELIYHDEDFGDVEIDQKTPPPEDENKIYRKPAVPPPPMMAEGDAEYHDNPDLPMQVFQMIEDEGAESENEILYESFDSEMIHYPRKDAAHINDTVILSDKHFSFPTPHSARVSSHFGPRRRRFHYGVDLALPKGEPIYAAFDGTVRVSKYNGSYGNLIVIRHNNGLETYYAHLSQRNVIPGDVVKAGEVIGLCGNTGRSYGSHLHFEIRYLGNAMNPENVIDCYSHELISETLRLTPNSFRKVAKKGASNASSGKNSSGSKYYKVRSGDTLSKIAKRNGTTVRKLCQLNDIRETAILPLGKRLRVR